MPNKYRCLSYCRDRTFGVYFSLFIWCVQFLTARAFTSSYDGVTRSDQGYLLRFPEKMWRKNDKVGLSRLIHECKVDVRSALAACTRAHKKKQQTSPWLDQYHYAFSSEPVGVFHVIYATEGKRKNGCSKRILVELKVYAIYAKSFANLKMLLCFVEATYT